MSNDGGGFRVVNSRPAIDALRPLLRAEASRGNPARLDFGDLRDPQSSYLFRHPLDLEALRAEFDFGPGVALGAADVGGAVSFAGTGERPAFLMRGSFEDSWWSTSRRARWWRRWNAAPRERIPFPNPFADLPS